MSMKSAKEIAQWVIDNRYPKSENDKISDLEMYHEIVDSIEKLCIKNAKPIISCDTCEFCTDSHFVYPCHNCDKHSNYKQKLK